MKDRQRIRELLDAGYEVWLDNPTDPGHGPKWRVVVDDGEVYTVESLREMSDRLDQEMDAA